MSEPAPSGPQKGITSGQWHAAIDRLNAPPAPSSDSPAADERPHSRACGVRKHDHGPECDANCPTCHGRFPPVPGGGERPDTAQMRRDAEWLRQWALTKVNFTKADRIEEAADWIDAQPAPSPGPLVDEPRAAITADLLRKAETMHSDGCPYCTSTMDSDDCPVAIVLDALAARPSSPVVPDPLDELWKIGAEYAAMDPGHARIEAAYDVAEWVAEHLAAADRRSGE